MVEIGPGVNMFPSGVPWLYVVLIIFFVFYLFVIFSPFFLVIAQYTKKFFLRCRCSLGNISYKDQDNIKMKMNRLGGAICLLQAPGREAPRREAAGGREDSSVLVGERSQEVCPVTEV
ncbi:uncharacterized protein LOC110317393 [Mus pahari]|uniref:uncharacterized protein LOC110317393 n=1 Tax=Mus pahari TaxID=10093 RepID=UPI000A30FFBA|nr:uncharacterized protein LOC110317393 [Mus pahari]